MSVYLKLRRIKGIIADEFNWILETTSYFEMGAGLRHADETLFVNIVIALTCLFRDLP